MKNEKPRPGGKKKKSSYKLKRSFTRNKTIRTENPDKSFDTKRSYKKELGKDFDPTFDSPKRGFKKTTDKDFSDKPARKIKPGRFDKDKREENSDKRSQRKKEFIKKDSKPFFKKELGEKSFGKDKPAFSKDKKYSSSVKPERSFEKSKKSWSKEKIGDKNYPEKSFGKDRPFFKKDFHKKPKEEKPTYAEKGLIRLNRYISNAGICLRRDADNLIASGCVSVNGKVITELGYKVKEGDEVNYSGQKLKTEKHVYVLLNKPKDYITTADDERGRRTVMELVAGACKERIYPVGRLDRNTMGLLLFTNNGEMTKKLTHPKHKVQKLYHVELDKNLKTEDFNKIQEGIELEDGPIKPDEISYSGESKKEVGILIHSGRNRIVRRIFEQMGYEIIRLDRIMFAGLTKKELPRGRWRLLNEKEIAFLKMI